MDGDFANLIVGGFVEGIKAMILWAFILGIAFVLTVGGLIWGGIYLYRHYSIVKTDKQTTSQTSWPQQSTNASSVNLPH